MYQFERYVHVTHLLLMFLFIYLISIVYTCRYVRHLKLNVGNKSHVEASMCNQYLTEEPSRTL